MNKKQRNIGIATIIIVALIALAIVSQKQLSFIEIQNTSPFSKSEMWGKYPVQINSVYVGDISNLPNLQFCTSNDGDINLANSYSLQQNLILGSSISGTKRTCKGLLNYISSEISLPAGELKVSCKAQASSSSNDPYTSMGRCLVGDINIGEAFADQYTLADQVSKQYTLTLDSPKTIKITVETTQSTTGSASAEATISFTEKSSITPPTNDNLNTSNPDDSSFTLPSVISQNKFSNIIFWIIGAVVLVSFILLFYLIKKRK